MAPITYLGPEPITYPRRKACLAHGSVRGALNFYFKYKVYRSGFFAWFAAGVIALYIFPMSSLNIELTALSTIGGVFFPALAGAVFLLTFAGGGMLVFLPASVVDCWLCIQSEYRSWNNGFCRATGKPWEKSYVGTLLYRRVCYSSGGNDLWLSYIEPMT
jgi:hypothetical protein